jgi:hypothetical protein
MPEFKNEEEKAAYVADLLHKLDEVVYSREVLPLSVVDFRVSQARRTYRETESVNYYDKVSMSQAIGMLRAQIDILISMVEELKPPF